MYWFPGLYNVRECWVDCPFGFFFTSSKKILQGKIQVLQKIIRCRTLFLFCLLFQIIIFSFLSASLITSFMYRHENADQLLLIGYISTFDKDVSPIQVLIFSYFELHTKYDWIGIFIAGAQFPPPPKKRKFQIIFHFSNFTSKNVSILKLQFRWQKWSRMQNFVFRVWNKITHRTIMYYIF
jgi:hypothetical protein